ncbi:energy-converting hydrogenase A subunit C [Methanococcus voltae]|uniref:Energy-converting hydrogenase A subunit C n=2 Tax=Methanococcus voltae TaxID=2188 RepID=A0A8J7RIV7_METVO|nr:DUF2109 domain-containing protein [Methanococcus voltae]MBP2143767.1 energy-converting hydrogenase A subunit C [Methanococcus voltae]MBP2172859.1 energy-converting hydrogenase A subunit C [Methanococcus voltae]MBP2201731.1 energy-converting hydrogenase A subunit C [Methanococcus voltae]MCS3922519.1 energy-converting hydrogenase A subunit C [Methanococcus voltae PS]
MESLVILTIGFIGIICVARMFLTKSRALKLPILCCLNFAIAALIALYINSPMGALVSIIYFVFATLSSNAIAHTIGELDKFQDIDKFEKDDDEFFK